MSSTLKTKLQLDLGRAAYANSVLFFNEPVSGRLARNDFHAGLVSTTRGYLAPTPPQAKVELTEEQELLVMQFFARAVLLRRLSLILHARKTR